MVLFSGSLEKHNKAYLKSIALQDLNNQYQKASHDVLRAAELKGLSLAETRNQLEDFQNKLRESAVNKLIPLSQTNAPEMDKQKISSTPMTASEYENKVREKTKREQPLKNLLQQIKEKKLKPIPKKEEKVISKTPFVKELEEKTKSKSSQATTASTTSYAETSKLSLDNDLNALELRTSIRKRLQDAKIPQSDWPSELVGKPKSGIGKMDYNRIYSQLMSEGRITGSGIHSRRKKK